MKGKTRKNNGVWSHPLGTITSQPKVEEGSSEQSFGPCGLPYATGFPRKLGHERTEKSRRNITEDFHILYTVQVLFPAL